MKIVPFEPSHLVGIDLQEWQSEITGELSPGYATSLASAGPAFTGIDGDVVVFCGGCAKMWEGRHIVWSMLSKCSARHLISITRAAKRLIEMQSGRIEAIIRSDFDQGHRWARMCGLSFHHHEERFLPNGRDADIYVRFV